MAFISFVSWEQWEKILTHFFFLNIEPKLDLKRKVLLFSVGSFLILLSWHLFSLFLLSHSSVGELGLISHISSENRNPKQSAMNLNIPMYQVTLLNHAPQAKGAWLRNTQMELQFWIYFSSLPFLNNFKVPQITLGLRAYLLSHFQFERKRKVRG